jgi:hypothetical protein
MKKLIHPITLKKCHFCKTRIEFKVPTGTTSLEYKCLCGKAHAFVDEKDMKGNSTFRLLEVPEEESNGR